MFMWQFYDLFKSPVLTPYDREIFFAKVHEIKTNEKLQQQFLQSLGLQQSQRVNNMFYQSLLREIVESMLAHMIIINEKEFVVKVSKHTSTEQEILYYIAGFIVRKITKAWTNLAYFARYKKVNFRPLTFKYSL